MSNILNILARNAGSSFPPPSHLLGQTGNMIAPALAFVQGHIEKHGRLDPQMLGTELGKRVLKNADEGFALKAGLAPVLAQFKPMEQGSFERTFNAEVNAAKPKQTGPAAGADAPTEEIVVTATATRSSYIVGKNQTIWEIAELLGVNPDRIQRENNISNPKRLMPGLELKVPDYLIQPGDTISSVAKKFGQSEDSLKISNQIVSMSEKKVGGVLIIDGAGNGSRSVLPSAALSTRPLDQTTPFQMGEAYRDGTGDRYRYFGPGSNFSNLFAQGNGAAAFQKDVLAKYAKGEFTEYPVIMNDYDYSFSTDWRWTKTDNQAEHFVGSWQDAYAVLSGDQIHFVVRNVSSNESLFGGEIARKLGIDPPVSGTERQSDNKNPQPMTSIHMTIEWTIPAPKLPKQPVK